MSSIHMTLTRLAIANGAVALSWYETRAHAQSLYDYFASHKSYMAYIQPDEFGRRFDHSQEFEHLIEDTISIVQELDDCCVTLASACELLSEAAQYQFIHTQIIWSLEQCVLLPFHMLQLRQHIQQACQRLISYIDEYFSSLPSHIVEHLRLIIMNIYTNETIDESLTVVSMCCEDVVSTW